MSKQIATYGSWKSPITVDEVFSKSTFLRNIQLDADDLYWNETRPDGRTTVFRWTPDEKIVEVISPAYDVHTCGR